MFVEVCDACGAEEEGSSVEFDYGEWDAFHVCKKCAKRFYAVVRTECQRIRNERQPMISDMPTQESVFQRWFDKLPFIRRKNAA